ncbi:MAG: ATP-binding protein [Sedimentisphaerales bacterium]|nr:ATP-binding protein [Sedimentisphaerales bacterium]
MSSDSKLKPIEVKIVADPNYVSVVRSAVRSAAALVGMAEEDIDSVNLALSEAITNVIRHGYGGSCDEPIILNINHLTDDPDGEALEFVLRDFGKQVAPETIKSRDLDEIRPGGLGVHIIKSIMDEVSYDCAEEKGMTLRMVKRVKRAP